MRVALQFTIGNLTPSLPPFISLLTTLTSHPPLSEVSALKGEITPIQSVSMGTISRQVQKIALFRMKVIYTGPS